MLGVADGRRDADTAVSSIRRLFNSPLTRIVFRPVNESEPHNVPPTNSSSPSEPTPAPSVAPESSSASVPPESTGSAPSPQGDAASSDAPSSPGGDGPSGDAASGETPSADSDGQKRRRRRRRRKAGADGEGAGAESAEGAGSENAEAATGDAQASAEQGRSPRAKKQRARGERGRKDRSGGHNTGRRERPGGGRNDHRRGPRDTQHSATVAVSALADMVHALLLVEGVDPLAMPRYVDLQLRVPLDGGNDIRHAAGTAVEQVLKRVRAVREHEQALSPGAVYSYFADSSNAEGCRPSEPRHVFDGYTSTGKPSFADFVTLAIERKDADVERMLAGDEIVLTHVSMGRVLRTQQLAEFGGNSPVFKILGQVDAGLFRVLGDAGRCAFSFQLLRGTTLEGRVRLRLHPVGAVDPMDLADPALMQIMSRFQRKLDTEALRLEGKMKSGEVDEEEFVLPLLQDFAKQLASRTRNQGRRTQHGMERSEASQRPTPKAYPDASEANDAAILWDIDQSTVIVLGPKGRVHVFSPVAKHVTSVVMQRSAVDRRRQQGRWRLAEPEERGEFRIQIKQLIASGNAVATDEDGAAPAAAASAAAAPPAAAPAAAPPAATPPAATPAIGDPPAAKAESPPESPADGSADSGQGPTA